jgi:hypothetical protein
LSVLHWTQEQLPVSIVITGLRANGSHTPGEDRCHDLEDAAIASSRAQQWLNAGKQCGSAGCPGPVECRLEPSEYKLQATGVVATGRIFDSAPSAHCRVVATPRPCKLVRAPFRRQPRTSPPLSRRRRRSTDFELCGTECHIDWCWPAGRLAAPAVAPIRSYTVLREQACAHTQQKKSW